jgi:hypothetical protein
MKMKYAEVICSIGKITQQTVMIDTGAQISCLSAEFLQQLIDKNVIFEKVPATNVYIKGATGVKSKRVQFQVYLPLIFSSSNCERPIYSHFYVVEKLAIPIILGFNWLYSQRAIIDLQ